MVERQLVIILPVSNPQCRAAARRCVRWLTTRLDGFSLLDTPLTDPAEPADEVVGIGVVRGWWRDSLESSGAEDSGAPDGPATLYRDRSVLLFTDIDGRAEREVESHIQDFIPYFFESYRLFFDEQKSLYLGIQNQRYVSFRRERDRSRWRLRQSTRSRQSSK